MEKIIKDKEELKKLLDNGVNIDQLTWYRKLDNPGLTQAMTPLAGHNFPSNINLEIWYRDFILKWEGSSHDWIRLHEDKD